MAEGLVGRRLLGGEYELREILGRGGMATVYRAYSRSLETDVAVKVLAPRLAGDRSFRERFHDEARSLARLHHPNLVEVHHYGEEGDLVYIVMREVPGGTLKDRLSSLEGPLDLASTGRVVGQVASALQLAHDRGLVHLDIKPANVLLGRADWPLLADFGITRAMSQEQTAHGAQRMAGTPLYMSPEQCRGGPIDGRSDQYSLAVTAFELLTGQWPFKGETTEALIQHQIEDLPPRPRELNPGIPGPVEEVLLRGLAKSPDERYPSVSQFASALTTAIEGARGVTLETKEAIASAAPNLLAVLALVLLGPLLLAGLPGSALVGDILPLSWPFKLLLAALIAGALLRIRWHLIGLASRGLSRMLRGLSASPTTDQPGSGPTRRWQAAIVASVEGVVNLAYLYALYSLLAVPVLGVLAVLAGPSVGQAATTVVAVVALVIGLGIVVGVARVSGLAIATMVLALAWAGLSAVPASGLGRLTGLSSAPTAAVAVSLLALAALLASRGPAQTVVRRIAQIALGPIVVEAKRGAPVEETLAAKRRIGSLVGGLLDLGYLLVGYALLRSPVVTVLEPLIGSVAAAILVAGLTLPIWLFLTLRLRAIGGQLGLILGLMLGAPIVVSLPILDSAVAGASWPATVVTWGIGIAVVLMLAAARGQVQGLGQTALGPQLDRGLLGVTAAPDESQSVRRVDALGGVVGALLDLVYLTIAYWFLGLPAATVLDQLAGQSGFGSLVLALMLVASVVVLAARIRNALRVVGDTGGPQWARRARALVGVEVLLAMLVVAGCGAAPSVIVAPAVAGALALEAASGPTLQVAWNYVLPLTPDQSHSTLNVALACSDGRLLGQFREEFASSSGAAVTPLLGAQPIPTGLPCDAWQTAYFALRGAAGVKQPSSLSRDWLDVQMTVNPDGTVNVVERHLVYFTAGKHVSLTWDLGPAAPGQVGPISGTQFLKSGIVHAPNLAPGGPAGSISDVHVSEGSIQYAPEGQTGTSARRYQVSVDGGRQMVKWWFPSVDSPTERTYTITYRVSGLVTPTASGLHFASTVISPGGQQPVWRTTVEVILPTSATTSETALAGIGMPSRQALIDGRTAWFEAVDAPAGSSFSVTVDYTDAAAQQRTSQPTAATPPTQGVTPVTGATATPNPLGAATPLPVGTVAPAAVGAAVTPLPTGPADQPPQPTASASTSTSGNPAATPTQSPSGSQASGAATATPTRTVLSGATATSTRTATTRPAATSTSTGTPSQLPGATSTPTATPSTSPRSTSTPTATPSPLARVTSTPTETPSPLPRVTSTPTETPTATPARTSPPTAIPTATMPPRATSTPTATPPQRATPTSTPTRVPATVDKDANGDLHARVDGDTKPDDGTVPKGPRPTSPPARPSPVPTPAPCAALPVVSSRPSSSGFRRSRRVGGRPI